MPEATPLVSLNPVLTVEEAARHLRIGRTSMYALVSSGEVESVTIGRLRRVPRSALDDYVNRLRSAGRAA
ncbi:helix-turn-helix domain-containing protein [Cryptosporangium aurantiacum]|uniref:helix-turn-helix domain-containing protein n=1 Tax=Cryptosporangium aurantiacum TaxID=134849 RepID=UPI000934E85B